MYKVKFKVPLRANQLVAFRQELEEWLDENVGTQVSVEDMVSIVLNGNRKRAWNVESIGFGYIVRFSKLKDMIFFKLAWSDHFLVDVA